MCAKSDHVCTISQPGPIQNKSLHPNHHMDVLEVWTKRFGKGINIGSNNLLPSLDLGRGVLMPKLAKKSMFLRTKLALNKGLTR